MPIDVHIYRNDAEWLLRRVEVYNEGGSAGPPEVIWNSIRPLLAVEGATVETILLGITSYFLTNYPRFQWRLELQNYEGDVERWLEYGGDVRSSIAPSPASEQEPRTPRLSRYERDPVI